MADNKAQLKAQLAAAKARAAAATKAYQNTPSYAANYAQVKQENDSAINELDKVKSAFDEANAPAKKASKPKVNQTTPLDFSAQIQDAQNQAMIALQQKDQLSQQLDMYPVDSAEYKSAKEKYDAAAANWQTLQDKVKELQGGSTQAATDIKQKQDIQASQDKVTALQGQLKRAQDKGLDTKNIQTQLDEAKKKAEASQAQTGTPTSNKLNAAQTDAFNAAVSKDAPMNIDTFDGKNYDSNKNPVYQNGANFTDKNGKPVYHDDNGHFFSTQSGLNAYLNSQSSKTTVTGSGKGTTSSTGTSGGGTSGGSTATYSKTAPKGAVGVDSAGNWVDSQGKVLGTSVAPAVSMMPKGAVGIEAGNWVDAKGNKLGSATPTSSTGQTANQDAYEKFRQQYGSEAAIIDSNPELKAAFNNALNAPGAALSTAQWQSIYENSNYYKNSYSSFLNAEQTRLAQPGSYVQAYNKAITDVKAYAAQAGISLDWSSPDLQPITMTPGQTNNPLASKQFDPTKPGLIDDILHKYWDTGANQTAITQYIASKGKIDPTIMGGKAQTDEQTLRSFAADLGLSNLSLPTLQGGDYFNNAATQIAQGGMVNGTPTDINYWKQDLINKAKDVYGGKYNTQLDAGQTIKSLAAPYINTLQGLLETQDSPIDLSSANGDGALIRNAMQKGTSPEDFAKQVMNDPRWLSTKNAKTSLMGIGNQFLSAFGLSALG